MVTGDKDFGLELITVGSFQFAGWLRAVKIFTLVFITAGPVQGKARAVYRTGFVTNTTEVEIVRIRFGIHGF